MASSTPAPAFRVSDRTLVGLCAVGTTNFVGCYAIAIALYPGGSWFDRHASGHSLARNFLCDLMQARALNGEPAVVGSLLARLGVVAMLLALAAFYSLVARLEGPPTHAGRITQGAGWLACVMGLAIPILTSDHHREAHIASVLGAFVPSLVATIFALIITLRVKGTSWWLRGAAVVTLVAGGIDGLLYGYAYAPPVLGLGRGAGAASQRLLLTLPMLQRVATVALLAWVGLMCLHHIRQQGHGATPTV